MLITNHRPHIPADDQAAWDRVLLIEFAVRFVDNPKTDKEAKQDKDLKAKLLAESSGILSWLVRGCLEWQKQGLNPPEKVLAATQAYREDEDTLGLFLAESCDKVADGEVQAKVVYKSYQTWANDYGMHPMNITAFGKRMKSRLTFQERRGLVYYKGIRLRA